VHEFESLILLLLAAMVLAAAARRVGAPYPAFLALGGAALAFVPGAPRFELEPSLALAIFVAPVLLDAAYDSSPRDLRDNWAALLSLVVIAVGLTTVAVAVVTRALVPNIPWAAAITLGAVVAPPDAAAATAVLRQLSPPHRIMTILEGESLLNDASALLIYRLAVGAALANTFSFSAVAPTFLFAVAGSIIVGPALAWVTLRISARVMDVSTAIIQQFITTFGVWILAEAIGLSGVLTMVCFAIAVSRRAPELTPARIRVPSYAVWETVVFLLNVLAFVFVGLQIRPILSGLEPAVRTRYLLVALAVLLTVIIVRIAWVMSYNFVVRMRVRRRGFHPPRPMLPPTVRGGLIISWSGMRGVVSLAAALALPDQFPYRDLIVLTAFSVVIGTLVVQGLTIKPLLRYLDLRDDDPVGREVELARDRAADAVVAALRGESSQRAEMLRYKYTTALRRPVDGNGASMERDDLSRRALAAARRAVFEMRANDEIGDTAFHRLEEEFDWMEMSSTQR
jgi:monovalent cation/hydrogen antiporter